jgi:hypothetical protein
MIYSSETYVLKEPYGVTFQKTAFFVVTAVKTSNLTYRRNVPVKVKIEIIIFVTVAFWQPKAQVL